MERSADWMDQVRGDLQHARSDVQGAFYDWACFSAQQAAEKAVKALFQRMAYVLVRRVLDLRRLEPHVYAEEEYAQVSATLERMVQDGITVYSASVADSMVRH